MNSMLCRNRVIRSFKPLISNQIALFHMSAPICKKGGGGKKKRVSIRRRRLRWWGQRMTAKKHIPISHVKCPTCNVILRPHYICPECLTMPPRVKSRLQVEEV